MSTCTFQVGTHGQLGKKPYPVLESMYRICIGLDKSLIPIYAISYLYTDSSGGILMYSRYPAELRWWLIHVGMLLWYVAHLTTYLDLVSFFKIQRFSTRYGAGLGGKKTHNILHFTIFFCCPIIWFWRYFLLKWSLLEINCLNSLPAMGAHERPLLN